MSDIEIGFKLFDQMIIFWQFYVGGLIGVVGWIFSREHSWSTDKRMGIGVTFILFSLINMSALFKTTSALSELTFLLNNENYEIGKEVSKGAFNIAAKRLNAGAWYIHIILHLIADAVALFFIFKVAKNEPKKS